MLRSRLYVVTGTVILLILLLWYIPHCTRAMTPKLELESQDQGPTFDYVPGVPKPQGSTYTKTIVVARTHSEDVAWLENSQLDIRKAIYVVDNASLSPGFQIPKNKGHEAMVYLTYIIDHFDILTDTSIFVHAHQTTWHNNDLLDSDMLKTVTHLNDAHVARAGYFNLRCHHEPGCPDWLHVDRPHDELDTHRKMEEKTFSLSVWYELHPGVSPPHAISQPCCAQFAVSRDRIRANPRSEYIRYRDWLLSTSLEDTYSGRIMEYSWQYLFAGVPELCPEMNECYCDGYGICLGGAIQLNYWFDLRDKIRALEAEVREIAGDPSREAEAKDLRDRAHNMERQLEQLKAAAFELGKDPKVRAEEVGRTWKKGDGY